MVLISSRQNTKIKQVRSLRGRKGRERTGLFLVEGIRHVGEAVAAGAVEQVFYAPELLSSDFAFGVIGQAEARGVGCFATSAGVFESLAEKAGPQGILAVARQRWTRLEDLGPGNFGWGVALARPQDPGNIGTVLRTLDAVGADGLILLDGGADPWHPRAVRASVGAVFGLRVARAGWGAFAGWAGGYHVYGASARGEVDYRGVDYARPCVLLLGGEREGLSEEQAAVCEQLVRLPMVGRVSSLNLGVAAGVLLYEMRV